MILTNEEKTLVLKQAKSLKMTHFISTIVMMFFLTVVYFGTKEEGDGFLPLLIVGSVFLYIAYKWIYYCSIVKQLKYGDYFVFTDTVSDKTIRDGKRKLYIESTDDKVHYVFSIWSKLDVGDTVKVLNAKKWLCVCGKID